MISLQIILLGFFFLSDLVLPRSVDLDDKKLIVLNPAEDELLLIGSLNRLNEVSFFQFAIDGNKFHVSKTHKDSWGVYLGLVYCLPIKSASFLRPDIIIGKKMTLKHLP